MNKSIISILAMALIVPVFGQSPPVQWQRSLGGTSAEELLDLIQTSDGGYAMVGYTRSANGNVSIALGGQDLWVVKLDAFGTLQWQRSFGGSGNDVGRSIQQTTDGGFIIGGTTFSTDGHVSGHHGASDIWVLKINTTGDLQWQRCLGGSSSESGGFVALSGNGRFIVTGASHSIDGDVTGNHGDSDIWVVMLSEDGDMIWEKNFGGSAEDLAAAIGSTSDGGAIIGGNTNSQNGDVAQNHGMSDAWVIKIGAGGELQWQKALGGSVIDAANDIQQTTDGGYIMAATSKSIDVDLTSNNGGWDMWVVKLDAMGAIQWQGSIGGSLTDISSSVAQTMDGGYIVAGHSASSNGGLPTNQGADDIWLVRLDASGTNLWKRSFGGSSYDWASAVHQTSDGGYILGGTTSSSNGDVLFNNGFSDFLVVKFGVAGPTTVTSATLNDPYFQVFPNPAQDMVILDLTLERSSHIRVGLYDELGQELLFIQDGRMPAGPHGMVIPISDLRAGVYHLRLVLDEQMVVRKVVKL